MIRYGVKFACMLLVLVLLVETIRAMQQEVQNQENSQAQDPKSLKIQALLAVVQSSSISDEQVVQLPQEIQKVAKLVKCMGGNINLAFFKAIQLRGDIFEVTHRIHRLKNYRMVPLALEFNFQQWLEQSYSLEDIYLLMQCGVSVDRMMPSEQNYVINAINKHDKELINLLYDHRSLIMIIDNACSMLFATQLWSLWTSAQLDTWIVDNPYF